MAVSGLLLMAVRTAPSLSNVKKPNVTYQSMTGVTVFLSLQLNKSGQKGKICWVTSKAQKSVGTITGRNQAMEIPNYRLKNLPWVLFSQSWAATSLPEQQEQLENNNFIPSFANPTLRRRMWRGKERPAQRKWGSRSWLKSLADPEQWANSSQTEDRMDEIPTNLVWKTAMHSCTCMSGSEAAGILQKWRWFLVYVLCWWETEIY